MLLPRNILWGGQKKEKTKRGLASTIPRFFIMGFDVT
jgi:hypothetical protein